MALRRFVGLPSEPRAQHGGDRDTETVRRIVNELAALPPEESRYLAGFAYILSRAAHADLQIDERETRLMEEIVQTWGGLEGAQAVLAVEIAKAQARMHGGTEDYLVTREFAARASDEQRTALLRCCFAVSAVTDSISAEESTELGQIASELGVDTARLRQIRQEFREQLTAIQALRRGAAEGG